MSDHDDFLSSLKNASSEEKLQFLRPEALRILVMAGASSKLVLMSLSDRDFENEIEDLITLMQKVVDSIEEMHELIDAITT